MITFILILSISAIILLALLFLQHKRKSKTEKTIPSREHWSTSTGQTSILFDLDLPFVPDVHDVIYVENEYDPIVNGYIQEYYEKLRQLFLSKEMDFLYLPKIEGQKVPKEVLQYMFPYLLGNSSLVIGDISNETLKQHLLSDTIKGPALIHFIQEEGTDNYCFSYCPLVPDSSVPLAEQFEWYVKTVSKYHYDGKPRYMLVPPEGDEIADSCFNDGDADSSSEYAVYMNTEESVLVKEIRDRIHELRRRGYQLGLLHDLVEEQPTLSRLVVNKDFRIFLPDYNNIEIIMPPLPKAVYLLFLKHPEGIVFKQLHDYYAELLDIYKQISNRVIERNIESSIRDITDPTKNSINEKCTRIREAFLKQFDYVYAQHYFITGKRGEPKKITLPRELVVLQAL